MSALIPMVITVESTAHNVVSKVVESVRNTGAIIKGAPSVFGTVAVDVPEEQMAVVREISGVLALEYDQIAKTADTTDADGPRVRD